MASKKPTTEHAAHIVTRPPIVVVMGHIDHGKSTLLDFIRQSDVVAGEAGGITQHVSAYETERTTSAGTKQRITFLDTPGHEAFRSLRSRGAKVADIAILVVSAEDGVKPQTIEALKAILEAKIPYVVAINKIDKPAANIDRTKQSLAENEIYVEGYGGTIPVVPISAKTGEGVPELLDMLELVAGLAELSADDAAPAEGVAIESNLDPKKGISATLIIKNGTLKSGSFVAAGKAVAPVRIMETTDGTPLREATFSSPVRIIGWSDLVQSGSPFKTFATKNEALAYAQTTAAAGSFVRKSAEAGNAPAGPAVLVPGQVGTVEAAVFPIIVKADTVGSLEAIAYELGKIKDDRISIKIIDQGLGTISEGDVKTASAYKDAVVVGFNVKADAQARSLSERDTVPIEIFSIIYKLTDWIKEAAVARTPKITVEEATGQAKILKVFSKARDKQIVGGRVENGIIAVGAQVKIKRRDADIGTGKVRELQQQKREVKEVSEGEFGTMIESKMEIAPGDIIVCFTTVEK